ncbi:MAG: Hsp20/alpha crystallin family protein [Spirochaetales bacterium]|jgi:HSP20 family protein|nr:Hsp20/alpha crystallin family protein [Spirochaetales bacterium]
MNKNPVSSNERMLVPACSIEEDVGVVTLKLEMPGVAKEGLDVSVEANTLTIEGRRGGNPPSGEWLLRERPIGSYRKVFTLDETIDRDKIEAMLADGMLTVKLHIQEAAKPRKIAIH